VGLLGIGIALTALSAAIAIDWIRGGGLLIKLLMYVGVAFFGLCTIIAAWRLFTERGPVVTITPAGIRDTRVAPELIPWSAVKRISTWEYERQKIMVLAVDPAIERTLTLTAIARSTRGINPILGANGLCIAATGLKIEYQTLFEIACAYASHADAASSRSVDQHGA
jgi:hypothetical protein